MKKSVSAVGQLAAKAEEKYEDAEKGKKDTADAFSDASGETYLYVFIAAERENMFMAGFLAALFQIQID